MEIKIETIVNAPLETVWNAWITPEDITQWNFASDDWQCPHAEVDFRVGGKYTSRMEAKDGSMGFDFSAEFTAIVPHQSIHFKMEDGREVKVQFAEVETGIRVTEVFEAEDENSAEQQRQGWLAILNNFKDFVESKE